MLFDNLNSKDELKLKISYYRKKSGLTQSQVADKMGMTRSSYAYAETRAEKLTPEFLNKLARVLGISPNVFLSEKRPEGTISLGNEFSKPTSPFVPTNKEQRIIKMLRMLPPEKFNNFYDEIRKECEDYMNSED